LGVPEVIPPGGGGSTYPAGNVKGTPGWMEMPEIPASHDGYGVYTHDMTIGSTHIRNYSFYWDYQNLIAWWVAYPLNSWTVGTGNRTDQWGLDPLLAEKYQPILYSGFKGGSYDRGHQIPSADRLHYSANVATFYFTNMTPQLSAFNQNIWANFENMVRSWGNGSDTLYVVTGCVPGKSTAKATDNMGKSVTVPEGYFKAVLRYKANSTFGFSDYAGCAVYLDHRSYSEKTVNKDMSMSIADLEKKLGYQFFVNLPAKVGAETAAKIKSQDPKTISWWWQ
jgi:endonuclease G